MKKILQDAVNVNNLRRYSNGINSSIKNAKKEILEQAKRYKNNTFASQMGFVAEEVHIGSFNIDSAIKRSSLKAVKEKNGFHGDYKVLNGSKVVAKGEFKHYTNASNSENAMRGYGDRILVGAKEQIDDIKKIAKRKMNKNSSTRPQVAKEHQIVHENVSDSIKKNNVSSKPKTLKQQRDITKQATKGRVDINELLPDLQTSLKSSAISGAIEGAKLGAIFGGGISTVCNVHDVIKNKKEAAMEITKDITKGALDSAIKNVAGSVAKTASVHVAKKVANESVKKVLGSSAPIIAATVLVDSCKDLYKCSNGEIDTQTVVINTGKNVVTAGGAWAGAEAGAIIGAFGGPAGVLVGGFVGSIVGSIGVSSFFA